MPAPMRNIVFCCLAVGFASLSTPTTHADPVTYTLTGTFTGTLGMLSFTSVAGTIT